MDGQVGFARVREDSKDMITAKLFRGLNRLGTVYVNNLGISSFYYYLSKKRISLLFRDILPDSSITISP